MEQATGGSLAQPGITFRPVHSNITAGNDINLVHNVTVNHNVNPESSVLTHLKTALSPVTSANYDSYEAKQRSECFPNTRVQVLNDIETWIHAESHQAPIYVLDGVAGIGKSTIAQTIAGRAAALGLLGGSFFFTRDEDLRRIARHFFPTIAYQLAGYDDQFATNVRLSLETTPDAPAKRLNQQMSLLWLEPLEGLLSQKPKPTLLVVDALDECEEENAEELLSLLGQHIHRMKGLKILITMRPEAHLRDVLEQDKHHERFRLHEIEDSIVHSDIRLYLQFRLSTEEISKVFHNRRKAWQPAPKDMDMLCGICGTLFIIAATATKFILDRKRLNPERQLARLLDGISTSGSSISKHTYILDETYVRIILAGRPDMDDSDDDWFRDLNKVLGGLVALANPIPCNALASLLDMDWEDIEATLSPLHSLVAPSGCGETMIFRIHHKSFPDFITNRERIRQVLDGWKSSKHQSLDSLLWVDTSAQHLQLAKACLRIMNYELQWNMMGIEERDWFNDKGNISHVISQPISPNLAYATLHWALHLRSAEGFYKDSDVQSDLDVWASRHILTWMEVMVILNQVDRIYGILEDAIETLNCAKDLVWTERARVQELLSDASRFVQQGSEIMRLSPMHIYRSCLPFIPINTVLGKTYHGMTMIKIGFGTSRHWDPLQATLVGHSGPVRSISFSSDSCRLASGSDDKTIRLWDAKTGAHISTSPFASHLDQFTLVTLSNDASQMASGFQDGRILLWDAKTGAHILTLSGHSDCVNSVAFSGDGSRLASGSSDSTIRLWDAKTGAHISTLFGHSYPVISVAFSRDGSRLASGSMDSTIRLWDANARAHLFTLSGHSNSVSSVAFSRDGSRLASGCWDNMIRLWDANTGAHASTLAGHTGLVELLAFSNDGSHLASGSWDSTIRLWDAKTGVHVSTLTGHSSAVNAFAFSGDGARLVSASNDKTIRFWDLEQATHSSAAMGHSAAIYSLAFSADGTLLASGSDDRPILLQDAKTGAYKCTLRGDSCSALSIAFSSDGTQLASASGSVGYSILLWDVKTGEHALTLDGHSKLVTSLAFSSDGCRLASGSHDKTTRIWDTKTGANISTFACHSLVQSVAFASNSSRLVSGSRDKTVQLWDATKCAHIFTFNGPQNGQHLESVAFCSNDSQLVARFDDGTIQIWDENFANTHISILTIPWISNLMEVVPLRDDAQMVNRLVPDRGQSFQHGIQEGRTHILALVRRKDPPITGLVMVSSPSRREENLEWEVSVVCWFPPNMEVATFAVDHVNSKVAVGCANGRIMALDFSSDSLPTFQ